MSHIYKRSLAEQDLINIWLYTYQQWGAAQADEYLDDIEDTLHLLADQPLLCRIREEFTPAVRIHHHKHHLIIYTQAEERIDIIRVLHESMDIAMRLNEGGGAE